MNKHANNLALAIINRATMRLDMAGLSIEVYGDQLDEMFEMIGAAYVFEKSYKDKEQTLGDLLKRYEQPE